MSHWTPKHNTNNHREQLDCRQKCTGRNYHTNNTDSSVNNQSNVYQSNVQNAYNSPAPYGAPTYAPSTFSTPNNNNNHPSASIADQLVMIKNEIQSLEEADCRRVYRICANLIDGKTSKQGKDPRVLNMENPLIVRLSEVLCSIGFRQITVDGTTKLNYAHLNMNVPRYVVETIESIQKNIDSQSNNNNNTVSQFDLAPSQYGSHGVAMNNVRNENENRSMDFMSREYAGNNNNDSSTNINTEQNDNTNAFNKDNVDAFNANNNNSFNNVKVYGDTYINNYNFVINDPQTVTSAINSIRSMTRVCPPNHPQNEDEKKKKKKNKTSVEKEAKEENNNAKEKEKRNMNNYTTNINLIINSNDQQTALSTFYTPNHPKNSTLADTPIPNATEMKRKKRKRKRETSVSTDTSDEGSDVPLKKKRKVCQKGHTDQPKKP